MVVRGELMRGARRTRPPSQHPLGRGDGIRLARIDLDRDAQRPGKALEGTLDNMVVVLAVESLDMKRDAGRARKAVEPVLEQFGIHLAKPLLAELAFPHEIGSPRNI